MPRESQGVAQVLAEYEAAGLSRLEAIRQALAEEKVVRDASGRISLRSPARRPGRQLLGI